MGRDQILSRYWRVAPGDLHIFQGAYERDVYFVDVLETEDVAFDPDVPGRIYYDPKLLDIFTEVDLLVSVYDEEKIRQASGAPSGARLVREESLSHSDIYVFEAGGKQYEKLVSYTDHDLMSDIAVAHYIWFSDDCVLWRDNEVVTGIVEEYLGYVPVPGGHFVLPDSVVLELIELETVEQQHVRKAPNEVYVYCEDLG